MMQRAVSSMKRIATIAALLAVSGAPLWPVSAGATSQWARKTGYACSSCHSVFPRLNSLGEDYLRNGYQLQAAHKEGEEAKEESAGPFVEKVNNLLGFRINLTPILAETNSLRITTTDSLRTRWTFGKPEWLQMFVAGSIYKDVSFFSELEMAQSAFKFNWFYFNFTNVAKTRHAINFQVGNISPLEFASYPNRLPQLPAIKGEVMLLKASAGSGETSVDMSSARPGLNYYGYNDWGLVYAGVSPGPTSTNGVQKNQFLQNWAGVVLKMPEDASGKLAGSTATLHYYNGIDTKGTGTVSQATNHFTRLSPQVNLRYDERLDIQAAYVMASESNRGLVAPIVTPISEFDYSGFAVEGGYMPRENWHLGLHLDSYESDDEVLKTGPAGGTPEMRPVIEYSRIVPAVTYIVNENIRGTVYWEHPTTHLLNGEHRVDRIYLNMRTMF